jgi:myo-inositol-1(or 4)-monophosphatase
VSVSEHLSFVRDALASAHESVLRGWKSGDAGLALGTGAYGDERYKVDVDAEESILRTAQSYYRKPDIISEEMGRLNGSGDVFILVDPIDGSTNAKRSLGVFSTSIAVAEGNSFSSVKVAGVMDHTNSRIVWGDSRNVYEDWSLASPSREEELERALISFDSKFYTLRPEALSKVSGLMARTKYPRVFSTAALETAYVATGRIDGYVAPSGRLRSFDCLPSLFLLRTAQCHVSLSWEKIEGVELDTKERFGYVAACTSRLFNSIIKELGE